MRTQAHGMSPPALLLPWTWVGRHALAHGHLSYLVWIALGAQGQVNCSDEVPRTSRSRTHTGTFYKSNPVSLSPVSPGQAAGPRFQKLFSALMGGNLSSWGELFSQGSALLAHRDVLVPQDYHSWRSPQVDLLIQSYTFLLQALGTGTKGSRTTYANGRELKFTEHLLDNSHYTLYPMCIILFNPQPRNYYHYSLSCNIIPILQMKKLKLQEFK